MPSYADKKQSSEWKKDLYAMFSKQSLFKQVTTKHGKKKIVKIVSDKLNRSSGFTKYNSLIAKGSLTAFSGQINRKLLYNSYDQMENSPEIAGGLDLIADECIGGSTIIPLLNGKQLTIKELYDNNEKDFWIYSLDSELNSFTPNKCSKVVYKGKKNMYKITLEDETTIEASENHLWLMNNGEFKRTDELKFGDGIKAIKTKINTPINKTIIKKSQNHRVISIEPIGLQDAYDLVDVGDSHVFAIESNDGSKIFCHNCTTKDEQGDFLTIKSDDENIVIILESLFYDILNLEYNMWPWIRNLVKFGDFGLVLDLEENRGIVDYTTIPAWTFEREEGTNKNDPKEIKFVVQDLGDFYNYEFIHFRLLNDIKYLPYGRSYIEPARISWKHMVTIEDAMLVYRITRAPERRIYFIDVGDLAPNEVEGFIHKVKNELKTDVDVEIISGNIDYRFTSMSPIEDYFIPTTGDKTSTRIETLPGGSNEGVVEEYDRFRCLRGDTKIKLFGSGQILTIKEIVDNFTPGAYKVFSVNPTTLELQIVDIIGASKTEKNAELLRIHLNNNKYIDCTKTHPFMMVNGKFKEAKDLHIDDSLMSFITNKHTFMLRNTTHKVTKIEFLDFREDTYDIQVSKNSNFALDSGIFVHNSKIFAALKIPKSFLGYEEDICLTSDTEIPLLNGKTFTIKELSELKSLDNIWVYSCDKNGNIVPGKVCRAWKTKENSELVEVTLDNNKTIRCTPNHPFLMRTGEYKRADALLPDDSIMPLYKRFDSNGYEEIYNPNSDDWKSTHIVIRDYSINETKDMYKGKIIHHNDFDKLNNSPENLIPMSWKEHGRLHSRLWWKTIGSLKCLEKRRNIYKTKDFAEAISNGIQKIINKNPEKWSKKASLAGIKSMSNPKNLKAAVDRLQKYREEIGGHNQFGVWKMRPIESVNCLECDIEYKRKIPDSQYKQIACSMECAKKYKNNLKLESVVNHKIVSVRKLDYKEAVFDLTVEIHHNFALNSGVFVKNSGKTTLAAEDVRFARTIERIQQVVIAELIKMAQIHLFCLGKRDSELLNYEIEMSSPSTISDKQKFELIRDKVETFTSAIDGGLSREWAYENIWKFSEEEIADMHTQILKNKKFQHRITTLEEEGRDPVKEKELDNNMQDDKFSFEDDEEDTDNNKKTDFEKEVDELEDTGEKELSNTNHKTVLSWNNTKKGNLIKTTELKNLQAKLLGNKVND